VITPQERPAFLPLPAEWATVPTQAELGLHGIFFTPGIDYCWVLHRNELEAIRSDEQWQRIKGLNPFRIAGQDVVLLARGEEIPGTSIDSCFPRICIDPELDDLLPAPAKSDADKTLETIHTTPQRTPEPPRSARKS